MARKPNALEARVLEVAESVDRDGLVAALVKAVVKSVPQSSVEEVARLNAPAPASSVPFKRYAPPSPPRMRRMRRASRVGFRRYEVLANPRGFQAKSWRKFMVETILAHTDTRSATEAHNASGLFPENKLDFNWCVKQGYIAYK